MPPHGQFVHVTPARTQLLMFDHTEPACVPQTTLHTPILQFSQPLEPQMTSAALLAVGQQSCSTGAWDSIALLPKYFNSLV